jgi:hypothetical protein
MRIQLWPVPEAGGVQNAFSINQAVHFAAFQCILLNAHVRPTTVINIIVHFF